MTGCAIKGAKLAIDGADIGVVDVSINEVGYLTVRMHGKTPSVCCSHESVQWCIVVQLYRVRGRKSQVI